ncbi:DUF4442 domain-containing protein [Chitinophaga horti]|uniref:DUF4442 domain-containing protein n=1 Tax=Chitinophaga horti TaxID=2920382 RepID=A0ABY6J4Z7_9BACT|nr:DUF4442 domain-containing protein [Chitinophaga horti]UYQ93371.1 DUF4442 domain-containing protein [Chitinophaga horti]
MDKAIDTFLKQMNGFKFKLFILAKLPIAFISGVRITSLNRHACTASVPFKWLSQNPFRSTYFACLSMAAEMSTGALAMMYVRAASRPVSMLVTGMEADFTKKAKGITWFTCNAGAAMAEAVSQTIATGEPVTLQVVSTGIDKEGQVIAIFRITWSFKANQHRS